MLDSLSAEDHESPDLSHTERIWYKYVTPSGFYYSPFAKSKQNLQYFESPEKMAESFNQTDKAYDIQTENLAIIYEKNTPQSEAEALPDGVYFHEFGNSATPERLSPMEIREDKYVDIMDSLSELDENIEQFINNKAIYTETCSAYKLGILLFGPPGSGKTSYMREFIRKKDAIVIFMDAVPTRRFVEKLQASTKDRLKIVVFEEAVSLLESSDDIREMLDFLDGSRSLTNTVYFLSTNYPESIPENVVRNGRIDLFVKVEYPNEDSRKKLFNLYLKRQPSEDELAVTSNMPIVDIREICFSHKKTGKSFRDCVKIVEEKNKMLKKHFGKSKEIRLA
jgi:predicted AAA+ superfamily ATPase